MSFCVSVVIATFRRDMLLAKALKSIAGQTYSNIEAVVVDDNGDEKWNKKVKEDHSLFNREWYFYQ